MLTAHDKEFAEYLADTLLRKIQERERQDIEVQDLAAKSLEEIFRWAAEE